jgi:hypothetical protein
MTREQVEGFMLGISAGAAIGYYLRRGEHRDSDGHTQRLSEAEKNSSTHEGPDREVAATSFRGSHSRLPIRHVNTA